MNWIYDLDNHYNIQRQPEFTVDIKSANFGWWGKEPIGLYLKIIADFQTINIDNDKVIIKGLDFINTYNNHDVIRIYIRYSVSNDQKNTLKMENVCYETYYPLNGKKHIVFKYSKNEKIFGTK